MQCFSCETSKGNTNVVPYRQQESINIDYCWPWQYKKIDSFKVTLLFTYPKATCLNFLARQLLDSTLNQFSMLVETSTRKVSWRKKTSHLNHHPPFKYETT